MRVFQEQIFFVGVNKEPETVASSFQASCCRSRFLTFMLKNSIILLILIILTGSGSLSAQSIKSAEWLEDFAQLKREMSVHYANLEWAVEERGLDLKQLSDTAEANLQKAQTQAEAKKIIEDFLSSFADAHLRVDWVSTSQNPQSKPEPVSFCQSLGYRPASYAKPGINFSAFKNFRPLTGENSKYLPAGVLNLNNGKKIGVIRIALFMETQFAGLCEKAASEMKLASDSKCDDKCEDKINQRVSTLLTEALAAQVEELKREKIDALLIDITSNGGGTNWYEPAARTLTPKPLRSADFGFLKHAHWTKQLKEKLEDVENQIQKNPSPKLKGLLEKEAENLRTEITETQKTCDRSGVWGNLKLDCSLVVKASKPVLSYAKPGEITDPDISRLLFGASSYIYREGVYDGKLMVLIDQRTASSSEAFTSMLSDSNAATVIGQPSMGAGCGYTNGGIETILKNSSAKVRMPDCVRFRADGSNEVAGITPDILIPWRQNDTPFQKAKRTVETLEKTLASVNK